MYSTTTNPGFEAREIEQFKRQLQATNSSFIKIDIEEHTDEYANFQFLGLYEGREVIYDAEIYTLRMVHLSDMMALAEHEAAKRFPDFKRIQYQEDENGDLENLDELEDEIGLFLTEYMEELEEDESVKVNEAVRVDRHLDFGIGLEVYLNIEVVSDEKIADFIVKFNNDDLVLDETYYTFHHEED